MTNKTNKTTRKNNTKQVVTWPTSHFTIDELHKANSAFKEITLRVRLNNAILAKQVVELGVVPVGKGRPQLAFAIAPVSETTLQSARDNGIMLHDSYNMVAVKKVVTNGQTSQTHVPSTPKVKIITAATV